MCGNYIVPVEKHIAFPNQRYLWFVSMDFLQFSPINKQDHRLKTELKFDSLVWLTFEKISDFSMHNVHWDTLYIDFNIRKTCLHDFCGCNFKKHLLQFYVWLKWKKKKKNCYQ